MVGDTDGSVAWFSEGGRNVKGCRSASLRPISCGIAGRELEGVAVEGVVVRGGGLDACNQIVLRKPRVCFDETEKRGWQAIKQELALLHVVSSQELISRPSRATPLLLSSDNGVGDLGDVTVEGNLCDVHTFLRAKTAVDRRNEHGYTPLHIALTRGDPADVDSLLAAGVSTMMKAAATDATLHCAACNGHPRALAALLLVMTDVLKLGALFRHSSSLSGDAPLIAAPRVGQLMATPLRLVEGALVEAALRPAASCRLSDIVRKLLRGATVGAGIHSAGRHSNLHISVAVGHVQIVYALLMIAGGVLYLRAITIARNYTSQSVLHLQVLHRGEGVAAAMILVISTKEAVNARHSKTAETVFGLNMPKRAPNGPLAHATMMSGGRDIVLALLAGGTATSRMIDRKGLTIVRVATRGRHGVHALLKSRDGDSLDEQRDGCGRSLPQLSSRGSFTEAVEAPIDCRALVYRINREGFSLLRRTIRCDSRSCAAILAVRGGRIDNVSGSEALQVDTTEKGCGHISAVQLRRPVPTSARGRFDDVSFRVAVHRGCSQGSDALVRSTHHAGHTSTQFVVGEYKFDIAQLRRVCGAIADFRDKAVAPSLGTIVSKEFAEVERAVIAQRAASATIGCLFEAIVSNREDLIHTLLLGGERLSISSVEAQQLLQVAAMYDRPHTVEILLRDYGANPDDTCLIGVSCLYIAAKDGFGDIVQLLLRFKADFTIDDIYGNSALMEAASGGHDAVVQLLLEAGTKPWTYNLDGDTALHLAVKSGHCSTIDILVGEGNANVGAFNQTRESPIGIAAKSGCRKSVDSLLDGAFPACAFEALVLAIYDAAKGGHVDCLEAMANHRVSIDIKSEAGWSSLQLAVQRSDHETARNLLQHGASVEQLDYDKNSIMHYTADSVMVECLIEYGAPFNWRNSKGSTPLHIAAMEGKAEAVWLLLKKAYEEGLSFEIDSKNNDGMTALHYAVMGRHTQAVAVLIQSGASSSVVDRKEGRTPMHMAVRLNHFDVLKILVEDSMQNAKIEDRNGLTVVHLAAQRGRLKILKFLLWSAIGPELRDYQSEGNDWTPLHFATAARCFGAVNMLLREGASTERVDRLLQTPLHIAAECDAELVSMLLSWGASLGAKNSLGQTPLFAAAECQYDGIVHVMLRAGASPKATDLNSQTAMHIAVVSRGSFCLEIVQALIAHGAPLIHRDRKGQTPLHIAVMTGQTDVVEEILEASNGECGISVADNTKNGFTPLHYAAGLENSVGREEIVALLLDHGAPVDARSRAGTSPLFVACACGYLTIAKILLSDGASPGTRGKEGFTPLHHACKEGQTKIVQLLLDNGAVPGHCWNDLGISPLHHAAREGHLEVVKLLLPRLVIRQINLPTKKGRTPLMGAVTKGHCDVVDALLRAGADPNEGGLTHVPPLSIAACIESNANSVLVVQSLLKKGADPGTFCRQGYLPLHRACAAGGDMQIVKELLNAGTPVGSPCPGEHFHLPLYFAALHGHAPAVRALASVEGCRLDEKDDQYRRSPLTTAIFEGHTETVRALLEAGAPLESNLTDNTGIRIGSHVHLAILVGHADICRLLLQAMAFEAQAADAQP